MSLTSIGAIHDLRIIFRGVDHVSNVADSIQSKVRALGGAISVLGGTGLFVTNLADQFGLLSKKQAESLDKVFALLAATGTLINVFARLAPAIMAAASAQNIMNAATAVADALSGPLGWALLAGAIAALAAWGLSQALPAISEQRQGSPPAPTTPLERERSLKAQSGIDTMVNTPTRFLAGEAGAERVTITPAGRMAGGGFVANITINGSGNPAETARLVKRELEILIDRERNRRG